MDIRSVLAQYDSLFGSSSPDEIAKFLNDRISEAEAAGDRSALLTLINEQIGFARDRGREEEALEGCNKLRALIDEMGLAGTIHYGRSLLNIANAYRAFRHYDKAETIFRETESLYHDILSEDSFEFAALYNNWSLLALDAGDSVKAAALIRSAISIADIYKEASIEQATSRVNLACILMGQCSNNSEQSGASTADTFKEAEGLLNDAIEIFVSQGGSDYHFASALTAKGDLLMKAADYEGAVDNYSQALKLVQLYTGSNRKTKVLEHKIRIAENHAAGQSLQESIAE